MRSYLFLPFLLLYFSSSLRVGVQDSLVSLLAGCVQCQTELVGVGLLPEAMELEVFLPFSLTTVYDVPTESGKGKMHLEWY